MKPRSIALAVAFCVSLVSTSFAKESAIGETSSASRSPNPQGFFVGRVGRVQLVQLHLTRMQERRLAPILRTEELKLQGIKNDQSLSRAQKLRRLRVVQNRSNRRLRVILTRSQFQKLQVIRQQRQAQLMAAVKAQTQTEGRAARSK